MSASLFAGLSAAAALLVASGDSAARLRRVLPDDARAVDLSQLRRRVTRVPAHPPTVAILAGVAAAVTAGPTAGVAAAVVAALVARALAHRRDAVRRAALLEASVRTVAAFAAELRAGRTTGEALDVVARTAAAPLRPRLQAAARATRLGTDPSEALRRSLGDVPGVDRLAACTAVTRQTGAPLADLAEALVDDLRATARRRRDVDVEVSAPRATARLLAGLPLVGVALGSSLGADPLRFLLHTGAGAAVLGVGLLLEVAGLAWTERMIRGVERSP